MIAVGYFDDPRAKEPAYDPGADGDCPVCCEPLAGAPRMAVTVAPLNSKRTYFYRAHNACYEGLTEREQIVFNETAMRKGLEL